MSASASLIPRGRPGRRPRGSAAGILASLVLAGCAGGPTEEAAAPCPELAFVAVHYADRLPRERVDGLLENAGYVGEPAPAGTERIDRFVNAQAGVRAVWTARAGPSADGSVLTFEELATSRVGAQRVEQAAASLAGAINASLEETPRIEAWIEGTHRLPECEAPLQLRVGGGPVT